MVDVLFRNSGSCRHAAQQLAQHRHPVVVCLGSQRQQLRRLLVQPMAFSTAGAIRLTTAVDLTRPFGGTGRAPPAMHCTPQTLARAYLTERLSELSHLAAPNTGHGQANERLLGRV